MPRAARGGWGCAAWTGLVESAMTTNRSAAAATTFSRVCAPPPPLTSQPSGRFSSAPSMVMSKRSMLATSSIRRPSSRAAYSVRGDVAAHTMSSDRRAGRSRNATVEPVPSPTAMPSRPVPPPPPRRPASPVRCPADEPEPGVRGARRCSCPRPWRLQVGRSTRYATPTLEAHGISNRSGPAFAGWAGR